MYGGELTAKLGALFSTGELAIARLLALGIRVGLA